MAIPETEIERVKQTVSLAAVIRARGVELKKKGRQLWGLCPFHSDSEPSFAVDERKGLWNCLGKCATGGDVFSFVMKADAVNFKQAFESLTQSPMSEVQSRKEKPLEKETAGADETMTKTEAEYLEKAAAYYHKTLLKNQKAIEYLESRGITQEAIRVFRIGFVDGSLKDKTSADGKKNLESLGLLNERGNETLFGSVVFPLTDANTNKVVSLYARHIEKRQHLYLSGKRRGVFNPAGAKETEEIILTESVIDALALWSIGLRNVTCSYGTNGLTDEITGHLSESRIKRVVLMLDSDDSGREAVSKFAAKLNEIGIESRSIELPGKDASEFISGGGTAEEIRSLLSTVETTSETSAELETLPDGTRQITFQTREYRVRGLSPFGLEKLKINLRLNVGNLFHLDTLDLYQARARTNFATVAAKACRVGEAVINADLLALIENLEAERLSMRKSSSAEAETVTAMSEPEREAAMSFLKDPQLSERIVEDFRKCGLVGERSTVLTAYLGAVSRKLSEPLALLIVARSGAGKTASNSIS